MKAIHTLKLFCEYLGASREAGSEPLSPRLRIWLTSPWLRGLWWGMLAGAILLFSGQTSKFIYIDF